MLDDHEARGLRLDVGRPKIIEEVMGMEENQALKLLRILRRYAKGEPLTDAQVRKLTRMDQTDIDIAAAQLEAEGMLTIERS